MKRLFFILMAAALLSGCASTVPHRLESIERLSLYGSEAKGQATVYVLRDPTGSGSLWPIKVRIDQVPHGSIRKEDFVRFDVAPGSHDLFAEWPKYSGATPDVAINADFLVGKTYYFVFATDFNVGIGPSPLTQKWGPIIKLGTSLRQISPAEAKHRLLTYSDNSE